MIVADNNLIAYLLLPSEHHPDFSSGAERVLTSDSEWAVPRLWRSEFRNVLALYWRKELLTFDVLLQIQQQAEMLVEGFEHEVSSHQVLDLVRRSTCSAYDCEYIVLAQYLNVPLVTQDKKVLREFPDTAISISDFLARH